MGPQSGRYPDTQGVRKPSKANRTEDSATQHPKTANSIRCVAGRFLIRRVYTLKGLGGLKISIPRDRPDRNAVESPFLGYRQSYRKQQVFISECYHDSAITLLQRVDIKRLDTVNQQLQRLLDPVKQQLQRLDDV